MEEIVTGEAVILDLPAARFPTRTLARLVDMLAELVTLIVIFILAGVGMTSGTLNGASGAAVDVSAFVLVIVGYPVAFETLSRGRTLGKMTLGLRVVSDDGGPVRFRQALVRGLAGAVECWALFGVPALVTSMLSARGKRLGDIFAGTFVVRERAPKAAGPFAGPAAASPAAGPREAGGHRPSHAATAYIAPGLRAWASSLELSAVPEPLAVSAASYLSRYREFTDIARERLGRQLAGDLAARVSPPPPAGLTPADYLYTVLAERRNRELARLMPPAGPSSAGDGAPWPARPPAGRVPPAQLPAQPPAGPGWPGAAGTAAPPPPQDTAFTPPV